MRFLAGFLLFASMAWGQVTATPAFLPIPGTPVWRGLSPGIGTSSLAVATIASVTAGCATGTVTIPSPLAPGNYAVLTLPLNASALGDRVINSSGSLASDLQTVTISRCNVAPVAVTNASANVIYLVLVYSLP